MGLGASPGCAAGCRHGSCLSLPAPGHPATCCLAWFLLPGSEQSSSKAHSAQTSVSEGGVLLRPTWEEQGGKCAFQPVPATVEKRFVVVGEEKAPQARWAVEMGLPGLWGAGTGVLAGLAVSLQPYSSATLPAWQPTPVGTGDLRLQWGAGVTEWELSGQSTPVLRGTTKPLHGAQPVASTLHPEGQAPLLLSAGPGPL